MPSHRSRELGAVRGLATELNTRYGRLDMLVHNAGVLPEQRTESQDGHELTLATHVLGPLLLSELLRPALAEYRQGRYRDATAYARSKRMHDADTRTCRADTGAQHADTTFLGCVVTHS